MNSFHGFRVENENVLSFSRWNFATLLRVFLRARIFRIEILMSLRQFVRTLELFSHRWAYRTELY